MSDSEDDTLDKELKIVFIGEPSVGKSCIVQRYCNNDYNRQYVSTFGVDFFLDKTVLQCSSETDPKLKHQLTVTLKIFDVGGKAIGSNMLGNYIHGADIVILVYDITNAKSFDALTTWLASVQQIVNEGTIIALLGNKSDMEHQRAVRLDRTQSFCSENHLLHHTVSARNGEWVVPSIQNLLAKRLNAKLVPANTTNMNGKTKAQHNESTAKVAQTARKPIQQPEKNNTAYKATQVKVMPSKNTRSTSVCSLQ